MNRIQFKNPKSYGMLASVTAILLLLALVLLNVGIGLLPKTVTLIDSSFNRLYTLSKTTEARVSALREDVTVYFLCENGTEDAVLRTFLDRYAALSSRITVKVIDTKAQPTFVPAYTSKALSNYSVILETKKRTLAIDYYDLYLWENEMLGILTAEEYVAMAEDATGSYLLSYYPTEQHFNGESKLTNGIAYVTADRIPKVYATSNHKETALGSDFKEALKSNAYEVIEGFSLLAYGGVPADCDVLLVNYPKADLSESEVEWISDYLEKGGGLILTTGAGEAYNDVTVTKEDASTETTPSSYPNLMALLGRKGLSAEDGVVVETDKNMSYSSYPVVLLPDVNREHPVTSGAKGSTTVLYTAHGIRVKEGATGVTSLFTTSKNSYTADVDSDELYEKTDSSKDGPFTVAAAATYGKGDLIWFASAYMLDDSVDSLVSGGNHAFAISACDYLAEKADEIALPSVSLEEPMLVITGNTAAILGVVFIGVIPFSILVGGLAFWMKRRRA